MKINDIRKHFQSTTFSNYKKTHVLKELYSSLYYEKKDQSLFWTCELLCSGSVLDLWNIYIQYTCKHIHISNPKLTTTSFRSAVTTITANTASLEVKIDKDKMNYALWSLMWLYSSTQDNTGFKGYEYNYANVRLSYKVNNEEISYGDVGTKLDKKYFEQYLMQKFNS
jgi:hypothetical protein